MAKTIWQTEIQIYTGDGEVTITRRDNRDVGYIGKYKDRKYKPTRASKKRLDKVVSDWLNRGDADITIYGKWLYIEPTI